jgi:hypothetical protein
MKFYRMTETAWAQIQAVGFSLQIGATIIGIAPNSWFGPSRGLDKRSRWPSCLAIQVLAADYNNGVRTAFGINLGSIRAKFKSKGMFREHDTTAETGWQFWRRT